MSEEEREAMEALLALAWVDRVLAAGVGAPEMTLAQPTFRVVAEQSAMLILLIQFPMLPASPHQLRQFVSIRDLS
jgi:hypothetical protein